MAGVFYSHIYTEGKNRNTRIFGGIVLFYVLAYSGCQFLKKVYYDYHIPPGPLHPKQAARENRQKGYVAHGTWTMNLGDIQNGLDHYPITWLKHLEEGDVQNNYNHEYLNETAKENPPVWYRELSEKDEAVIRTL